MPTLDTATATATHLAYLARAVALHREDELRDELARLGVADAAAREFAHEAGRLVVQVDGVPLGVASGVAAITEAAGCRVALSDPAHRALALTGTAGEIERAIHALEATRDPAMRGVGDAVRLAVARSDSPPATVTVGAHTFDWAKRVYVMGILNATPDSFSDFGRYFKFDDALRRAHEIAHEGADMIEVGGQTAQPGEIISEDEELSRIVPLLERLRAEIGLPLAVDTWRVGVARGAVAAGVAYINDIGGGDADDGMARLAAETGVLLGIMHLRGKPRVKQWNPVYESVMDEVTAFLHERVGRAVRVGVRREQVVLDPGLGFGKEAPHDLDVMHRFAELRSFGLPILLATSRKNYLSDTTGGTVRDLLPETAAAVGYGIARGANIVRVHDVGFMARVARIVPHLTAHEPHVFVPGLVPEGM